MVKVFRRSGFRNLKTVYPKFFRVGVEVGEASASAPLGPLLGQLQVPLLEFCDSFNKYSVIVYNEPVDLRVQLTKVGSKYTYFIKYPPISFFFKQFYLGYGLDLEDFIYESYQILKIDLWYLFQICSAILNIDVFIVSQLILGSMYTSTLKAIILVFFFKKKLRNIFSFFDLDSFRILL